VPPSKDKLYKPRVYKTLETQEHAFLDSPPILMWLDLPCVLVPPYLVKLDNFLRVARSF
jgi:hypothetical protein